ncbi:unnamed protein product, partial [Brassica rapa subsp. narinosa]
GWAYSKRHSCQLRSRQHGQVRTKVQECCKKKKKEEGISKTTPFRTSPSLSFLRHQDSLRMVRAVTVTVTVTSATASSEPANQNPGAAWHHEDSSGVPGDEGHSGRVGDTSHTSSQAHLGLHQGTRSSSNKYYIL